ncbi:MAG: MFS transporter [Candidatus Pelagibacter sp.]|nr:MFS transporter [Candidatus Pelagibacter sp.]OUV97066.1 MAG: MFS transporter [Candidatus Pelagibacter sp. TMED142]
MKSQIKHFIDKKSLRMFALGFSAGLPILLVFSTLSVWLTKADIERSTITLFSWVGFAYSFKFLWSPIVDHLQLPMSKYFGHRKTWLLLSQIMLILSILLASLSDPKISLMFMVISFILIAFSSATQDITIDAFRIESVKQSLQGVMSSMYLGGYRIAMIFSGAGSLWLVSKLSGETYDLQSWQLVYKIMAVLMIVGLLATLFSDEPNIKRKKIGNHFEQLKFIVIIIISIFIFFSILLNLPKLIFETKFMSFGYNLLKILISFIALLASLKLISKFGLINNKKTTIVYIKPMLDFINRYKKLALIILLLISIYRISDIVMGVMANIFYVEKGYTLNDIAFYSKFVGLIATITGGVIGGLCSMRFGSLKALLFGSIIAAITNLLFAYLAISENNIFLLASIIIADNLASGFAGAAFIVYLSSLTSIKFTATQYALFSSLMLFFPKLIAGYSGAIVDIYGYANFFIISAILGLPVIFLILFLDKFGIYRK